MRHRRGNAYVGHAPDEVLRAAKIDHDIAAGAPRQFFRIPPRGTLDQDALDPDVVSRTLGCLLKARADLETIGDEEVAALVAQAREGAA